MTDTDQDPTPRIQLRAYLLWQAEGRADGRADEYWHRARDLIEAETRSAYPPTQARGHLECTPSNRTPDWVG